MMGAVGSVLNDHPDYKAGTILVADMSMLLKKTYYSIAAQTMKELQAKVKNDDLDLAGAWSRLSAELKPSQP